jgi:hypothetical protein
VARTIVVVNIAGIDLDVIEAQLAHGKSRPLGPAYEGADYIAKRRSLMQIWAEGRDDLRISARASSKRPDPYVASPHGERVARKRHAEYPARLCLFGLRTYTTRRDIASASTRGHT